MVRSGDASVPCVDGSAGICVAVVLVAGCAGEDAPEWVGAIETGEPGTSPVTPLWQPSAEASPRAATRPSHAVPTVAIDVGGRRYTMRVTGLGSLAEMRRDLTQLHDPRQQDLYRCAFVKTFYWTRQPGSRPYYEALRDTRALVASNPGFAPAWRCLGYAMLHLTGDVTEAVRIHRRAVGVDPSYAEAHYMLALLLAMGNRRGEGARHFDKARELGLPDSYGLAGRFYPTTGPTPAATRPRTD